MRPRHLFALSAGLFILSGVFAFLFGGQSLAANLTNAAAGFCAIVGLARLYEMPQSPKRKRHHWHVPFSANGRRH